MKLKRHHAVIGAITLMVVMFGFFSMFTNPLNIFRAVHGLPRGNPPSGEKFLKAGTVSPNERAEILNKSIHGKNGTP